MLLANCKWVLIIWDFSLINSGNTHVSLESIVTTELPIVSWKLDQASNVVVTAEELIYFDLLVGFHDVCFIIYIFSLSM